jgi:hypothetical protein
MGIVTPRCLVDGYQYFGEIFHSNSLEMNTTFERYEVFVAVTMKNATSWDFTPCSSCMNRRFGGTCGLHHQGSENRRARNNGSNN